MATKTLQQTSEGIDEQTLLRDRAIRFTREVVDLAEIDITASEQNQARFLAIHPETVELYTAAMKDGATFPPIVVYRSKPEKNGKPKTTILDGNHRLRSALAAGYDSAEMLVVTDSTQAQRELFTYEANAKHGLPTTMDERIAQAVYLVGLGNQAIEVAQALGIPERKLWDAVRSKKSRVRIEKLGGKIHPRWSPAIIQRMGSIHSDVVLVPLAKLVFDANLSYAEADALITAVNALSSEGQQVALVTERRSQLRSVIESTAGGALSLPREVNALRVGIRMFATMEPHKLGEALDQVTPEYRAALGKETIEAISKLITLASQFKS